MLEQRADATLQEMRERRAAATPPQPPPAQQSNPPENPEPTVDDLRRRLRERTQQDTGSRFDVL